MDLQLFEKHGELTWVVPQQGAMRVPGVIYATEALMRDMDGKVYEQLCNVATLPGIVGAAYAMPDAHWGYGFPIGGVAAFDAGAGGVVSAGGVGFDISCGVRMLHTGIGRQRLEEVKERIADTLYRSIPVGLGRTGKIHLGMQDMDRMLLGGARWAVEQGWGRPEHLERIEERGCMSGAEPDEVSDRAKKRQQDEMGTLGSGNHYLEVQHVTDVYDSETAGVFGLRAGEVVLSIHCGSRGLGHQIGTEFLRDMAVAAKEYGIELPDRELACAPLDSPLGSRYLGAMRAGINCALANRQIIHHLVEDAFTHVLPEAELSLLYDVSHNTCKLESHRIDGQDREVFVHRKGATRAFGPGHPALPESLRNVGQPVLIGGSMGTGSYVLAGNPGNDELSFASACHGAGRSMSRKQATHTWQGRSVVQELASRGILIRSPSMRGVAEEAPGAYKDVSAVVEAADHAGLARIVARVEPLITVKG